MCLVVGDSYVWRLRDFVASKSDAEQLLFIRFFGEGGASLFGSRKRFIPILDHALASGSFDFIYFNVGSNDVGNVPAVKIATALLALAHYVRASYPSIVIAVGQLHFRHRQCMFNGAVRIINDLLHREIAALGDPRVTFVRVRGLYKPPPSFYCDGIHFNHKGQQCLLRAIRKAICDARAMA